MERRPQTTAEKLLASREAAKGADEKTVENQKEYQAALNSLLQTPDGLLVFKVLIKYLGINSVDTGNDPIKMVVDRTKRNTFLEVVRPYLDATSKANLDV